MIKARKFLSLVLAVVICIASFPSNVVHAEDSSSAADLITVSDGATNYPVTLSSYSVRDFPAGVYEATLPKDYSSATVTWSGCYVYCGCNKYDREYEDGHGSLTVEPHKCKAPKAFGDFPEDAVMLYLVDTDYNEWACLILYAGGDTQDDDAPITVSDGATNYPVTLSSYSVRDFPAGVYEATLPKDYSSATVTWSGCYVYCGCNKYDREYEDGHGSLTVEPHKCKAPKAFGDFPEDAVMLYLVDTDYNEWACLILYAGDSEEKPDTPKQKHALSATASLIFSHHPDSAGNRKGTITFKDTDNNVIEEALTGETVTVVAAPKNDATFEFVFDHWTTSDISLTEDEKKSSTLTFTMPDSDVNLHADFKNKGTLVSWCAQPDTVADVHFSIKNQYGPDTFKTGTTQVATIVTSDWVDQYEFLGWQVTCDGEDVSDNAKYVSFIDPLPAEPTYGKFKSLRLTIAGNEMQIVAKFKERKFASVTATVNDSTMGTATAAVGTGTPSATLPVVFEDQTVTLTAAPGERYTLDRWEVKDADGVDIPVTQDAENANQATFTMPGTSKDITAKAFFKLDPDKASKDNVLSNVSLYFADGKTLIKTADKSGTAFTITLPEDQDTTNLANFVLKFEISDYATIRLKGAEDAWPTEGKACNMTLDSAVTFVVTAENGGTQEYTVVIKQEQKRSSDKEITAVKLLNADKSVIASGTRSGETWTIDLPSDIDQTLLNKIGTSTDVFMQIDYTGASVAQEEGYNDAAGTAGKWSSGNVMCGISPNAQASFTVTAEDGSTKSYVVKITYTAAGTSKPTLSNGAAERTSDTAATVTFTSSAAGSYYYRVVESGATEPEISTTGSGTSAKAGTNTISLTNLTAGARDIYIVVKSEGGEVSDSLKVAIPAFGEEPTDPDTGDFTITVNCPKGGTITTSRTKANQGDVITVTATPDSGYQLVAGSLKFTLGVAGGESTVITNGTFTMPSCDVTISCKWETVQTVVTGITAFSIDGVQGVVDNAANTISVVMPYGTDVTKLIPIISGNNIASISPASGEMVNFTNSVRYTVTLTDGTTKDYMVTVYVQEGSKADQMWDKLTDFYDQTPWWEYAEHQTSTGHYPKYW